MDDEDELRRLRLALYRPDPPADARQRYEELVERLRPATTAAPAEEPGPGGTAPEAVPPRGGRPRRRALVASGAAVLLAVGGGIAAAQAVASSPVPPGDSISAALDTEERARLALALTEADPTVSFAQRRALWTGLMHRADLDQLDAWDGRNAVGWVQRGRGPVHRDGRASERGDTEPITIVLQCERDVAYRWTVKTDRHDPDAEVLLGGAVADHCGEPSAGTVALPPDAGRIGFDLQLPPDVGWTMAVVVVVD